MVMIYKGKLMSDVEYDQLMRSLELDRIKQEQLANKPSLKGMIDFYRDSQSYVKIKEGVVSGLSKMKKTKVKDIVKKK